MVSVLEDDDVALVSAVATNLSSLVLPGDWSHHLVRLWDRFLDAIEAIVGSFCVLGAEKSNLKQLSPRIWGLLDSGRGL